MTPLSSRLKFFLVPTIAFDALLQRNQEKLTVIEPNLGRKAVRYLFYDKISHVTCSTFMKRNVMLIVYLILIIRIYCKVKYMGIRETLNAADSRSKPQWIRLFSFNLYTCKTKEAMYAETLS